MNPVTSPSAPNRRLAGSLLELCASARLRGRKMLSVYLTAGFPRRDSTKALMESAFEAGADFIELGIPFSDPLADGPTIQAASDVSLRNGTTLADVFLAARRGAEVGPILLMGYFNSVAVYGRARFLESARASGASGLIIADLPPDEEPEFHEEARKRGIPVIPFIAPTTPIERIRETDGRTAPFIYAVSLTGVTGARNTWSPEVISYLEVVRGCCTTPVVAGFGIRNGGMARALVRHVDGVIVGSSLIELITRAGSETAACESVREFVTELRNNLDEEARMQCS